MSNRGTARAKSTPFKILSAKVEAGVGRKAIRYAEKRNTNVSVIIEEALIEYLRTRAPYFSDSSS